MIIYIINTVGGYLYSGHGNTVLFFNEKIVVKLAIFLAAPWSIRSGSFARDSRDMSCASAWGCLKKRRSFNQLIQLYSVPKWIIMVLVVVMVIVIYSFWDTN